MKRITALVAIVLLLSSSTAYADYTVSVGYIESWEAVPAEHCLSARNQIISGDELAAIKAGIGGTK